MQVFCDTAELIVDQAVLRILQLIGTDYHNADFFVHVLELRILRIELVHNHFQLGRHAPPVNRRTENHCICLYDLLNHFIGFVRTNTMPSISFAAIARTAAVEFQVTDIQDINGVPVLQNRFHGLESRMGIAMMSWASV